MGTKRLNLLQNILRGPALATLAFAVTFGFGTQKAQASTTEINAMIDATRTTFFRFHDGGGCTLDEEFCYARSEFLTAWLDSAGYNVLGWIQVYFSKGEYRYHVAPVVEDSGALYIADTAIKAGKEALLLDTEASLEGWASKYTGQVTGWNFIDCSEPNTRPGDTLAPFNLDSVNFVFSAIKLRTTTGAKLRSNFRRQIAGHMLLLASIKTVVETSNEAISFDTLTGYAGVVMAAIRGLSLSEILLHLKNPALTFSLPLGHTIAVNVWPDLVGAALEVLYGSC